MSRKIPAMQSVEKTVTRLEHQRKNTHDKTYAGISTSADRKQFKNASPWRLPVFSETAK